MLPKIDYDQCHWCEDRKGSIFVECSCSEHVAVCKTCFNRPTPRTCPRKKESEERKILIWKHEIETLRARILFDEEIPESNPLQTQYCLAALSHLEQAVIMMRLAYLSSGH